MIDIKMRLSADSKEAEQAFDRVEERASRVKDAVSSAMGGGESGSPIDSKSLARDMADEFGRRAGAQIGKFIGGFLAHEGLATAFNLNRKVGQDNSRYDQAQATIESAISMGTAGAMVGGAPGAVVGALLGGLNAFVNKEKEIQDRIAQQRLDYSRERYEARAGSKTRQEERLFDYSVGLMSQADKIESYRKRAESLTGQGGDSIDYYANLKKRKEELESARAGRLRMQGSGLFAKDSLRLEEEWAAVKDDFNGAKDNLSKALDAIKNGLTDTDAFRSLTINGNAAGTRGFYEALMGFSTAEYGADDERTKRVSTELNRVNSLIDPLQEKELEVYINRLDQLRGLSSREAITDSLSSRGMGVGAQISTASANDKILRVIEDIYKVIRTGDKSAVEYLRKYDFEAVFSQ